MTDIDIANRQLVGTNGDTISVMAPRPTMTKEEALVHAAWLIALADPLYERFPAVLDAVLRS